MSKLLKVPNPVKPAMSGQQEVVVYITCFSLFNSSGGSMVCRQHIERLAAVKGVRFVVCTIGSNHDAFPNKQFVNGLGAEHRHIALAGASPPPKSIEYRPSYRWHLMFERHALSHAFVQNEVAGVIDEFQSKIVVLDYLHTALFATVLYEKPLHRVTITLNPEARFFAEMRRLGRLPSGSCSDSKIAELRMRSFEDWVYRNSSAVVALSQGDLPVKVPKTVERIVISPVLPESPTPWQGQDKDTVLFVGNWAHHPNYCAIQWLAEAFAPKLLELSPQTRLKIVGASADEVPKTWLAPNVEYLGTSTSEEVQRLFRESALFIAPIENDYGSKIKVLECLSYGAPLVATPQALTGAAFAADAIPQFGLNEPDRAAQLVAEMLSGPDRLRQQSRVLRERAKAQDLAVGRSWQSLIDWLKSTPAPRPGGRPLLRRVEEWIWD